MLSSRPGVIKALPLLIFAFSTLLPCVVAEELWRDSPWESDLVYDRTDELEITWSTVFSDSRMMLWCKDVEESIVFKGQSRESSISILSLELINL